CFFFSSRRRHTSFKCDWSSDVCSSDLVTVADPGSPAAVLDRLLVAIVADQAGPETRAVLTAQLREPQITRLSPDDRGPANTDVRSEERRVGKASRARRATSSETDESTR